MLLAVGDSYNDEDKAEIYNFETERWTAVASYPFGYVYYAPVIHSRDSFYIIGGSTGIALHGQTIARFSMDTMRWTRAGNLNDGRFGHGAIELGDSFLIIGGWKTRPTEQCTINADGKFECNSQQPDLTNYSVYPELFKVPNDFC